MLRFLTLCLLLCWPSASWAIVFYDTADGSHNTSAPSGLYSDSGWQYLGIFGDFMGTAISSSHFITAQHIGVASGSFYQPTALTGGVDVTHTIDASANGGIGYWDIAGTDLRVYQITGSNFSEYAPLYDGLSEVGLTAVVTGRGGPRGAAVTVGPTQKGWETGGSDGQVRWGTNVIGGSFSTPEVGDLLYADFDALPGLDEAHLSVGDSGGSMFVLDGGVWKLAGVHYAVDGLFSHNADGSDPFSAALYDMGGIYVETGSGWAQVPNSPVDIPSSFYSSRISSSVDQIQAITVVPEPGSAVCVLIAAGIRTLRRKRPSQY